LLDLSRPNREGLLFPAFLTVVAAGKAAQRGN
jgi:hypothetical protein